MKPFIVLSLALALCGCAYPVSTVSQGSAPTGLFVPTAPADATLAVDGVVVGQAAVFDGRKTVLPVQPGKHHVVVRGSAGVLFDKDIYVGAGSKVAVELVK
ncbi:hypothetical protein ASD89_23715 [Caulobacter sp. Root656]|nr:hypothetical protein ASD89_23715 [Caulobacter sp. Root656]